MERKAFALLNDMEKSWWYRGRASMVHAALTHCAVPRFDDVLDFGAGYGGMFEELSMLANKVYAFEPDAEAKGAAEERGYTEVFSSEDEALSHAYDACGLFDVVEHIDHDQAFLVRAHRALRENGRLIITVPAFAFLWSVHDVNHHHFRRYTKRSMRSVLESAGFSVEYMTYWNMVLFIPAAAMRLIGKSGDGALSMPRWIDAIFFMIIQAEAMLARFVPLPFGTGLVVIARKK